MKRAILIILDGLGVGAMPDVATVRPEDIGAHTLAHLLVRQPVELPVLTRLGLGTILQQPELLPVVSPLASYGTCLLQHVGADTYAGHNEIMGSKPKAPIKTFVHEVAEELRQTLCAAGLKVTFPLPGTGVLLVNDKIVVADNMETDPGQIINVTGSLDELPFSEILQVGKLVREVVKTSRVIALGGTGVTTEQIIQSCYQRGRQCGVNTPGLHIYNEQYRVRHLGYGIDPEKQIPTILQRSGIPVYLYGKVADVVQGEVTERDPLVPTKEVFHKVLTRMEQTVNGFICATVQETDLAGHEQDCAKYASVLQMSDQQIGLIIEKMNQDDLLLITADHGNDPVIGHSRHTREATPLLIYQQGDRQATFLSVRKTLADVAATIADYFQVKAPENGRSVWMG